MIPAPSSATPSSATGPITGSIARPPPARGADEIPGPDESGSGPNFSDVLSALNPLQYLPVVGTIYRAVTGDTVPEAVRVGGSLGVSFLMGGPVGLAIGAVSALVQKLTGFDPDAVAHRALVSLGMMSDDPPASAIAAAPPPAAPSPVPDAARIAYGMPAPASETTAIATVPVCDPALCNSALAAYGQSLRSYGPMLGHI